MSFLYVFCVQSFFDTGFQLKNTTFWNKNTLVGKLALFLKAHLWEDAGTGHGICLEEKSPLREDADMAER